MPEQNSRVVSPTELAALIAKSQSRGFSPLEAGRSGIARDSNNFKPANFESIAKNATILRPERTQEAPEGLPDAPIAAPAPVLHAAFVEHAAEPARDFDAELATAKEAARAEGEAQGYAKGLAEAAVMAKDDQTKELETARDLFLAAASALGSPATDLIRGLSAALQKAIPRLAAERAGMAIDANPAAFLARVELLAERVSQGVRDITVTLHPDDLLALQKHLSDNDHGFSVLGADARLERGDVIIKGQGLMLADVLDPSTAERLK